MLKDLYVMKVDAKQELDNFKSADGLSQYKDSIYIPEGIDINLFLEGEKYFLVGEKGAGKTALLIYIALIAEDKFDAERSFIIFKEFSQEEKEDYAEVAHVTNYEQTDIKQYTDYEYVWRWIIHNNIAKTIETSDKEIFVHDENLGLYLAAVDAVEKNPRGDKRFLPMVSKDGYVNMSMNAPVKGMGIKLEGQINFEKNPANKEQARFSTHINELDRLFVNLSESNSQLYVVVDELNLSTKNYEEYDRDIQLIRDSIIVIDKFNAMCKNSHDNVRVIGAVRNEVIDSVKSRGKEVNKVIESYGVPVDWTVYKEEKVAHPLIKVLINYLRLSDASGKKYMGDTDEEVFNKWVVDTIYHPIPSVSTILDYTLYRPRHIVRLLSIIRRLCPKEKKITYRVFQAIKKEYGKECWNEVMEELSLKYKPSDLTKIQEWLTGMPYKTTYGTLYEKAKSLWGATDNNLLEHIEDIIRDIYNVGIIGNVYKESSEYRDSRTIHRWAFRGDDILQKNKSIQIHRIFQTKLDTVSPKEYARHSGTDAQMYK